MKILVSYDDGEPTTTQMIEGKSLVDCLRQIVNDFSYPLDEEEFGEMNEKDFYNYIDERNGDGCPFIISMVKIRDDEDILFEG